MNCDFIIFSLVKLVVVIGAVLGLGGLLRAGRAQDLGVDSGPGGPNRAPPFMKYLPVIGPLLARLGVFQPLADGLKSFSQGGLHAGRRAQSLFLAGAGHRHDSRLADPGRDSVRLANWAARKWCIADLNVGILYTFGIVSLGVYGIVLAGYAANSKYPFLGGIARARS